MLTQEQKATLKAHILANTDPAVVAALAVRDDTGIADWYNTVGTFVVWRSSLSSEQARTAITGSDGLAQLDNLTAGKRDSLLWVFDSTTNPSSATQRAAILNLCGTQNDLKAAITAVQKRTATRLEALFATGTGSDASPGTLTAEGAVSVYDISVLLNS
jgi:hypothetical protein